MRDAAGPDAFVAVVTWQELGEAVPVQVLITGLGPSLRDTAHWAPAMLRGQPALT